MKKNLTRSISLLQKLISLDAHNPEYSDRLDKLAQELSREVEKEWEEFEQNEFHEIQHFIMSCEKHFRDAEWKKELDEEMKEIVYKLMKRRVEPGSPHNVGQSPPLS